MALAMARRGKINKKTFASIPSAAYNISMAYTASNKLTPLETVYSDPLGYCMYCGSTENLTKEHIIPYWMVGGFVVPHSSCRNCADITKKFEGTLSNGAFAALRQRLDFQSRSGTGKKIFDLIIKQDGAEKTIQVSAEELPPVLPAILFPRAGFLEGRIPSDLIESISGTFKNFGPYVGEQKIKWGTFRIPMHPFSMLRLAAKIVHGLMVSNPIYNNYQPLLADVILKGCFAPYYVGSVDVDDDFFNIKMEPEPIHVSSFRTINVPEEGMEYLIGYIHLLKIFGGPAFEVVTGRKPIIGCNIKPSQFPLPYDELDMYEEPLIYNITAEIPS